jgi:hypothetical protein
VRLQQKYYQVADRDYSVIWNQVLHWWEFRRNVAKQNDLKVYFINETSQEGPFRPQDLEAAFSKSQKCIATSSTAAACANNKYGILCQCATGLLKRIVLVWKIGDEEFGLSVHRDSSSPFKVIIRARDYYSGGIIGLYSVLSDTKTMPEEPTKMIKDKLRTYELTMDLGTQAELKALGQGWE